MDRAARGKIILLLDGIRGLRVIPSMGDPLATGRTLLHFPRVAIPDSFHVARPVCQIARWNHAPVTVRDEGLYSRLMSCAAYFVRPTVLHVEETHLRITYRHQESSPRGKGNLLAYLSCLLASTPKFKEKTSSSVCGKAIFLAVVCGSALPSNSFCHGR